MYVTNKDNKVSEYVPGRMSENMSGYMPDIRPDKMLIECRLTGVSRRKQLFSIDRSFGNLFGLVFGPSSANTKGEKVNITQPHSIHWK